MPELSPAPPSRAALAAVLVQAAESEPLLADLPAAEISCGTQRIDLANGWSFWISWRDGTLGPLLQATAPDGSWWSHGCDRWPDWNAGPDAVVLDPLRHLISADQRQRLEQRLLSCCCWPEPDMPPRPALLPLEQIDEMLAQMVAS
ncbi:MAG: hypothetical protein WCQ20_14960 [Synechococcaceae cyanobacterium ELA739]